MEFRWPWACESPQSRDEEPFRGIVSLAPVISVQNVSKCYHLYPRAVDRLWSSLSIGRASAKSEFWAVRNVSFRVEKGEVLALLGPNGSGKSTLLQIISGILQPTSGRVLSAGRIAALLELGAGFNPEFTGRENVYMNGEIMGLSRPEIERAFPKIEAFAEIGQFMDRPVKEYSTGMYVRLAFSTAIHVEPEILIVDEALSVGDAIFASRCIRKFEELREQKLTVLLVSHDLGLVKRLADRAVFLLNGEMQVEGTPNDVVNRYMGFVLERQKEAGPAAPEQTALTSSFRHGDRSSYITDAQTLDRDGTARAVFERGETMRVRIRAQFRQDIYNPVVGILVRSRLGMDVFGTNTRVEGIELGQVRAGEQLEVEFDIECLFSRQEYTLTVATQHWDGSSHDWLDDVLSFRVADSKDIAGVLHLRTEVRHHITSPESGEGSNRPVS